MRLNLRVKMPTITSQVTAEEFARYADLHLGVFKCEVCGTQDWNLELDPAIEAGPDYVVKHTSDSGQNFSELKRIPVCIISCKHCGNVKMFLRERVDLWLKENPNG
jgi:hypothetical protein